MSDLPGRQAGLGSYRRRFWLRNKSVRTAKRPAPHILPKLF